MICNESKVFCTEIQPKQVANSINSLYKFPLTTPKKRVPYRPQKFQAEDFKPPICFMVSKYWETNINLDSSCRVGINLDSSHSC